MAILLHNVESTAGPAVITAVESTSTLGPWQKLRGKPFRFVEHPEPPERPPVRQAEVGSSVFRVQNARGFGPYCTSQSDVPMLCRDRLQYDRQPDGKDHSPTPTQEGLPYLRDYRSGFPTLEHLRAWFIRDPEFGPNATAAGFEVVEFEVMRAGGCWHAEFQSIFSAEEVAFKRRLPLLDVLSGKETGS